MRPGRELDCKVAEEVFGHRVHIKKGILFEETPQGDRPLRKYTKEMDSAFEVAEKMKIAVIPVEGGQWFALVGGVEGWRSPAHFIEYLQTGNFKDAGAGVADSPSLAICSAAYNALEARKKATGTQENGDGVAKQEELTTDDETNVTRIH